MPETWTGELICKMHNARITKGDLAQEMGVSKPYVSMVLNGVRNTKGMQERMEIAVARIIQRRSKTYERDV